MLYATVDNIKLRIKSVCMYVCMYRYQTTSFSPFITYDL